MKHKSLKSTNGPLPILSYFSNWLRNLATGVDASSTGASDSSAHSTQHPAPPAPFTPPGAFERLLTDEEARLPDVEHPLKVDRYVGLAEGHDDQPGEDDELLVDDAAPSAPPGPAVAPPSLRRGAPRHVVVSVVAASQKRRWQLLRGAGRGTHAEHWRPRPWVSHEFTLPDPYTDRPPGSLCSAGPHGPLHALWRLLAELEFERRPAVVVYNIGHAARLAIACASVRYATLSHVDAGPAALELLYFGERARERDPRQQPVGDHEQARSGAGHRGAGEGEGEGEGEWGVVCGAGLECAKERICELCEEAPFTVAVEQR